jgi:hypothetical protein
VVVEMLNLRLRARMRTPLKLRKTLEEERKPD